jgi:hypothetical protein
MSKHDDLLAALKPLFVSGLIHEAHIIPHAQYVPFHKDAAQPDGTNVSVQLNATNPEDHKQEILRLLEEAEFGTVYLSLHPNYSRK